MNYLENNIESGIPIEINYPSRTMVRRNVMKKQVFWIKLRIFFMAGNKITFLGRF